MSVSDYLAPEPGEEYEEQMTAQLAPAIVPVHVMLDESETVPPEFASCMTWTIPQTGVGTPVQILQRRYHRMKAKFLANFPGAGTLIINTKYDPLTLPSPQGFMLSVLAAGSAPLPEYDSMQPVWAIATISGITLSVLDESYGQVQ
jgi:hypothetical protein